MATSEQRKEWNKKYYQRTKHLHNEARYARRDKIRQESREWVREYKSTLKCVRCGFDHPAALDFHHIDSTTKSRDISGMITSGYTIEQIKQEINKCEVLCANCHRIEHFGMGEQRKMGLE